MALGLGALALPAAQFWALTPRELDAALAGKFGQRHAIEPPGRGDLDRLMRQFPDL